MLLSALIMGIAGYAAQAGSVTRSDAELASESTPAVIPVVAIATDDSAAWNDSSGRAEANPVLGNPNRRGRSRTIYAILPGVLVPPSIPHKR
jgi:hypothetical protein